MTLSHRERQILSLIGLGLSTKEIGIHLHLSENTIKTHRKNLLKKYKALNCANLIYKARYEIQIQDIARDDQDLDPEGA